MSIKYKIYQDNRRTSAQKGKFYARAIYDDTVTIRQISKEIEQNVSVKESDVFGVLIEMVNVIKRELQAGHIIRIERLGSFRMGIKTKPANTAKEFSALKNVVGYRVNFMPEYTITRSESGKSHHVVALLEGATSREAAEYGINKEGESTTEEGTGE